MANMSGKLPGKRYRKNKEVYMWHVAGPMNWSVAITPQRMYWSERIWKHRDFKEFPEALAYAKKLANVLGNGQQKIKVIGSPFVRNAKLDGSEVDKEQWEVERFFNAAMESDPDRFDRAIVLALFDEVKAVVDSGIVDSFEIALATVRMTLPEQVAVVALAVRKGIEISDLTRWGLKE